MTRTQSLFTLLLAGSALAACNNAEQRADNAAAAVEAAADATGTRIENVAESTVTSDDPAPGTADFLNTAAKSDAFEIAAAKLAAKNAASAEVKAYAQQMIAAHTDSTAKIKAAASKANPAITLNPTLTADQNEDLTELGKLTGAKFDEEYIDSQVDAHEKALKLMQSYASGGADAGLKTVASEISPVVEGHLKMARDLDAKTDK